MSFEGGSGETCFQRFPPNVSPIMQNQKWGWKGVFDSTIFIPLTVGVRTMIIVMMGTTHPHLQASVASAPGGGNQRFPRNEGGRGERSEPTLPPAFRRGRNPAPGTPTSLFCNPGGGEVSPPQTPTSQSLKISRISSKWVVWVFPSIPPTSKIRRKELTYSRGSCLIIYREEVISG